MNNEAILNKLVELGYLSAEERGMYKELQVTMPEVVKVSLLTDCWDALISECGKKGYLFYIDRCALTIQDRTAMYPANPNIHKSDYSRQAVVDAFCKVTGIEI